MLDQLTLEEDEHAHIIKCPHCTMMMAESVLGDDDDPDKDTA